MIIEESDDEAIAEAVEEAMLELENEADVSEECEI